MASDCTSELERLRAENARLRSELAAERSVPVINADTGEAELEDLGPRRQRRRLEGGAGVSSNSSNTGEEGGGGGGESTLARLVKGKTENVEQAEELENAQELNQHLVLHGDSKMSEIDTLAARNAELEQRVADLDRRVQHEEQARIEAQREAQEAKDAWRNEQRRAADAARCCDPIHDYCIGMSRKPNGAQAASVEADARRHPEGRQDNGPSDQKNSDQKDSSNGGSASAKAAPADAQTWPPSLRKFVEDTFQHTSTPVEKKMAENALRNMITNAVG